MPEPATQLRPRVIIAGCGAITAVGHGVDPLRSALHANASGLRPSARFDSPRFQSSVVGAVSQNGSIGAGDDPAYHLASKALDEAREQAQAKLAAIPAHRIGLV